MKVALTLAALAAAALVYAFTANEGPPALADTTAPAPAETGEPEPTTPALTGEIGTALVCDQNVCKEYGEGLLRIDSLGVEAWRWRALKAEKRVERLLETKQRLLARVARKLTPTAQEEYAVHLAAIAYEQSEADMRRVVACESGFYSGAYNSSSGASGIGQFLGGTWRSTPYGHLNVFEPVANALAIGWMWANGRRGEWVCR